MSHQSISMNIVRFLASWNILRRDVLARTRHMAWKSGLRIWLGCEEWRQLGDFILLVVSRLILSYGFPWCNILIQSLNVQVVIGAKSWPNGVAQVEIDKRTTSWPNNKELLFLEFIHLNYINLKVTGSFDDC